MKIPFSFGVWSWVNVRVAPGERALGTVAQVVPVGAKQGIFDVGKVIVNPVVVPVMHTGIPNE